MSEIILSSNYSIIHCANCSIGFAVPKQFETNRRGDHDNFYCPRGHKNYYPQENDYEKLLKENQKLQSGISSRNDWIAKRDKEIKRLENSKRALKAHLTIKKNKLKELRNKQ